MRDWLSRGRVGDPPIFVTRNEPQAQTPATPTTTTRSPRPEPKAARVDPRPVKITLEVVGGEPVVIDVKPSDRLHEVREDIAVLIHNTIDASLVLRDGSPHCSAARIEIARAVGRLQDCGAVTS